jgi:hypothetical protein
MSPLMKGAGVSVVLGFLAGLAASGAEPRAGPGPWVTYPFNGKDLDGWEARDKKEAFNKWQVGKAEFDPDNPGQFVVKPGGSDLANVVTREIRGHDLVTEACYGDGRIEIEVMVPKGSNSGIYVMGTEIQVLDGINNRATPKSNMGAIYGRHGPLCFPAEWRDRNWDKEFAALLKSDAYLECVSKVLRPPGEWQKFIIECELSKTDPATKTTRPARPPRSGPPIEFHYCR